MTDSSELRKLRHEVDVLRGRIDRTAVSRQTGRTQVMVGKVLTTSPVVGKWIMVDELFVSGATAEGGTASIASMGRNPVPVWLVGPGVPVTGDNLICKFVNYRWVAERSGCSLVIKPVDGYGNPIYPATVTLYWSQANQSAYTDTTLDDSNSGPYSVTGPEGVTIPIPAVAASIGVYDVNIVASGYTTTNTLYHGCSGVPMCHCSVPKILTWNGGYLSHANLLGTFQTGFIPPVAVGDLIYGSRPGVIPATVISWNYSADGGSIPTSMATIPDYGWWAAPITAPIAGSLVLGAPGTVSEDIYWYVSGTSSPENCILYINAISIGPNRLGSGGASTGSMQLAYAQSTYHIDACSPFRANNLFAFGCVDCDGSDPTLYLTAP